MAKKKKKQDPMIVKAREEKRQKKLAKALRVMEKKERQPKPLIECEIPVKLHKETALRTRPVEVPYEVKEERIYQAKDWSRFAHKRHTDELWHQDKIMMSQLKALEELKKESLPLYFAAIEFDTDLLPMSFKGPVNTPPIPDYLQDGEYEDKTQTFKVIYEDTEAFLKQITARRRLKKKKGEDDD